MADKLVIWVEGDRDRRFFERVVQSRLAIKYDLVIVREYRQLEQARCNKLLTAMAHQGFDRLFVADMNSAPCVSVRKTKLRERYPAVKPGEIIVVSKEIESWYLAGLTSDGAAAFKIVCPSTTDRLTKENLDELRPGRFDSQLDFLIELLEHFDATTACSRNQSFAYFWRKFGF